MMNVFVGFLNFSYVATAQLLLSMATSGKEHPQQYCLLFVVNLLVADRVFLPGKLSFICRLSAVATRVPK